MYKEYYTQKIKKEQEIIADQKETPIFASA